MFGRLLVLFLGRSRVLTQHLNFPISFGFKLLENCELKQEFLFKKAVFSVELVEKVH